MNILTGRTPVDREYEKSIRQLRQEDVALDRTMQDLSRRRSELQALKDQQLGSLNRKMDEVLRWFDEQLLEKRQLRDTIQRKQQAAHETHERLHMESIKKKLGDQRLRLASEPVSTTFRQQRQVAPFVVRPHHEVVKNDARQPAGHA